MLLEDIHLTETYDNVFINDTEYRQQYGPRLLQMIRDAYQPIGGIKGIGFSSVEDMIDNIPMWKVVRRGNDIKAVIMYKDKSGRKVVAMATDNSREGKQELARMIKDEYAQQRSYIEVSGPLLAFYKKLLGDELTQLTIHPSKVATILKIDPAAINILSDTEYERELGGTMITKQMIGYIGNIIS